MKIRIIYLLAFIITIPFLLCGQSDVAEVNYRNWVRKSNSNKDKLALVIGNSEYMYGGRLVEPSDDAKIIAEALQNKGYDVEIGYNLDRKNLYEAIKTFAVKFENYNSALIYYAGHGFQIAGENYLIPVDAKPENEIEAHEQCINVESFFRAANQPDKPKIIILDACRNNPFSSATRSTGNGIGSVQSMLNAKIIFSTAKNTVVQDDNPFTEIFSQQIEAGGCISAILGRVSKEVRKVNPNQLIWQEGLLEEDICFGESQLESEEKNKSDIDKDGIPDDKDMCPEIPGSIRMNGCPDRDKDGLIDIKDLCPDLKGDPKLGGCPDSDKDGIIDAKDACPQTYGSPEMMGCPKEMVSTNEANTTQKIASPKTASGSFTDERDNQTYNWVVLRDGNKWMRNNLNFQSDDSWCYDEKKKNCQSRGRLYTWNAAKLACPKGWRLPTQSDWNRLIKIYGGEKIAFTELTKIEGPTLRATFSGIRDPKGNFTAIDSFGQYWSSNSNTTKATYFDFNKLDDKLNIYENNKNWAMSCRCIQ